MYMAPSAQVPPSKPMKPIDWDIRREGRIWSHEEFDERIYQAPEKIEYVNTDPCRSSLNLRASPLPTSRSGQPRPISHRRMVRKSPGHADQPSAARSGP